MLRKSLCRIIRQGTSLRQPVCSFCSPFLLGTGDIWTCRTWSYILWSPTWSCPGDLQNWIEMCQSQAAENFFVLLNSSFSDHYADIERTLKVSRWVSVLTMWVISNNKSTIPRCLLIKDTLMDAVGKITKAKRTCPQAPTTWLGRQGTHWRELITN